MSAKTDSEDFGEEAAIEAAQQRNAAPHLRDILKREHDEILEGRPRDMALEKWGAEIEEQIMRDLQKFDR